MIISYREETGSTNDDALACLQKGEADDRFAVLAAAQTGGRGRLGRAWESLAGNMFASYVVRLSPQRLAPLMSLVAALAVREALRETAPDLAPRCKWPNDVLVRGRKISGILLEGAGEGHVIAGVGVNLAKAPDPAGLRYPATSLAAETDAPPPSPEAFCRLVGEKLYAARDRLQAEGFPPFRADFTAHAYGLGKPVLVTDGTARKKGVFEGIDETGLFQLRTEQGALETLATGDISYDG